MPCLEPVSTQGVDGRGGVVVLEGNAGSDVLDVWGRLWLRPFV